MATELKIETETAYDDPEKGTTDAVVPAYPRDEKPREITPPQYLEVKKGEAKDAPRKPTPKPKKKVSKWILLKLWFNTYRYA